MKTRTVVIVAAVVVLAFAGACLYLARQRHERELADRLVARMHENVLNRGAAREDLSERRNSIAARRIVAELAENPRNRDLITALVDIGEPAVEPLLDALAEAEPSEDPIAALMEKAGIHIPEPSKPVAKPLELMMFRRRTECSRARRGQRPRHDGQGRRAGLHQGAFGCSREAPRPRRESARPGGRPVGDARARHGAWRPRAGSARKRGVVACDAQGCRGRQTARGAARRR